jgi:hypothetical protein
MKNATQKNNPSLAYLSDNNYDIRHAFNVTGYWDCNKAPKEENRKGQCILIGVKPLRISNDTGGVAIVEIDRIEKSDGEFSHPGWLDGAKTFSCRVYFKKNKAGRVKGEYHSELTEEEVNLYGKTSPTMCGFRLLG